LGLIAHKLINSNLFGQLSVTFMTKDRYNKVKIVLFLATENFDFIQHG